MSHCKKSILFVSGAWMLLAGVAMADAAAPTINNLPDKGSVTVSGTVDKVQNDRDFVLRDDTGSINVKINAGSPLVLKQGDKVTVSGQVERPLWGLMGKDIKASNVDVHQDLSSAISNAVTDATGITMNKADNVQIGKLPDQGLVQITGTIKDIDNPQHFTVQDSTGSIDVSVKSAENVVLAKGAEVTVTGYVGHGVFQKTINATHVTLLSNAPANTGRMNTGSSNQG